MSEAKRSHLVVVGSSAGGIEALGVLVAGLPADFPAPVVLAQHLDPSRPSQLAGILERRTQLPVVLVGDETPLEPGHIYVVPSNRHVVIRDGKVALEENHSNRPHPSIDLLLSTAARSYGEQLIAVILTGSGTDGAAGAVEVKEHGGTVLIQNPKTAAHPSMPSSLPPTAVDHVSDIEQIGQALQDIVGGDLLHERLETSDRGALDDVLAIAARYGSIDFRQYKPATILRRIGRRMSVHHAGSIEEYRDYLAEHPAETEELIKSLLIKVTEFFRDSEAFSFLEHEILPKLIDLGRERDRVLRLWSAGCATGEESYSLALLIAQMLGNELPEWSVKIFATDVDEDAIGFARRGFYPANVLRNLTQEHLSHYFEPADQGYRVGKALRQMIIFGQQDLSRGVPFPRIDLVTCRNLLIYFKPELQQVVLDLFAYSLHQTQGYLFLGKAETVRPSKAMFELVNKKWKIYRCVSGHLPVPLRLQAEKERTGDKMAASIPADLGDRRPNVRAEEPELRHANELLLRHFPVGVCMIDRSYRIISINAAARRLLGVREAATDQDFLHTIRGIPYGEVRSAIDRAFRERSVSVLPRLEMGGGMGEGLFLTLQIIPFDGGGVETALVCVENISELVQTERRLKSAQSEQSQLSEELGSANLRLLEMNKDLQEANERLQAANEEMMLTQEELQATNEEIETTNEELQATNEELETNNEELQATNEELETTNEELSARTSELQELTRILTGERRRLTEIVEQAPFHILVLRGPSLVVESMNPEISFLFENGRAPNRPFEVACTDPALEAVRLGMRRSFAEGRMWRSEWTRMEVRGEERYFQFSAVPTHSGEGTVDGVVLYVEDVTDRRARNEQERMGKVRLMLDHANQLALALFDARTGRLVHASRLYLEMISRLGRVDPASAIGTEWAVLWFGGEEAASAFERVVQSGESERLNEVHYRGDGEPSVWDCTLIPIAADGTQEVEHVVLTAVEVTRPVLAREQLEQVDRLKDGFLSLASHELRTPLTPLAAYIELLAHLVEEPRRDPAWESRVKDVIGKFRRQIGYMSRLTEDLVDVARIRSGRLTLDPRPVDLRRIVEEGLDQAVTSSKHPSIKMDVRANGGLTVQADEMRLIQVVYNLLSNAIKNAPANTDIQLRVDSRAENGTRWGRVEVRDFGSGIPDRYRDELFQRFLTPERGGRAAREGLGLGLFISARIVEQHGGRIGAEHHDPGTTVWFEVPLLT